MNVKPHIERKPFILERTWKEKEGEVTTSSLKYHKPHFMPNMMASTDSKQNLTQTPMIPKPEGNLRPIPRAMAKFNCEIKPDSELELLLKVEPTWKSEENGTVPTNWYDYNPYCMMAKTDSKQNLTQIRMIPKPEDSLKPIPEAMANFNFDIKPDSELTPLLKVEPTWKSEENGTVPTNWYDYKPDCMMATTYSKLNLTRTTMNVKAEDNFREIPRTLTICSVDLKAHVESEPLIVNTVWKKEKEENVPPDWKDCKPSFMPSTDSKKTLTQTPTVFKTTADDSLRDIPQQSTSYHNLDTKPHSETTMKPPWKKEENLTKTYRMTSSTNSKSDSIPTSEHKKLTTTFCPHETPGTSAFSTNCMKGTNPFIASFKPRLPPDQEGRKVSASFLQNQKPVKPTVAFPLRQMDTRLELEEPFKEESYQGQIGNFRKFHDKLEAVYHGAKPLNQRGKGRKVIHSSPFKITGHNTCDEEDGGIDSLKKQKTIDGSEKAIGSDVCSMCKKMTFFKDQEPVNSCEKPCESNSSDMELTQLGSSQCHNKRHVDVKVYKCCSCGKRYMQKFSFRHKRYISSYEKIYNCYVCGTGFVYLGNLKRHQKFRKCLKPYYSFYT